MANHGKRGLGQLLDKSIFPKEPWTQPGTSLVMIFKHVSEFMLFEVVMKMIGKQPLTWVHFTHIVLSTMSQTTHDWAW